MKPGLTSRLKSRLSGADPKDRRSVLSRQRVSRRRSPPEGGRYAHLLGRVSLVMCRSLLILALLGAISVLLISGYDYLLNASCLRLEEVILEGADGELREEILRAAGVDYTASLLAVNLREVERRIRSHPWVKTARVERQFPHRLTVQVEVQQPCALVLVTDLYYMNPAGEIFAVVSEGDDTGFPLITGLAEQPERQAAQGQEAIAILETLEGREGLWAATELSEIHFGNGFEVSLYFCWLRAEIKLAGGDLEGQLEGLTRVVAYLDRTAQRHQVSRIYLNEMNEAVVTFRKGMAG